ncbi:hypothetical protein FSP39_008319 [Pinctada imbricata]|uniref:Vacuolar protein sorting-associated protein 33B n=1 Tax=Pinctada imbricata TaxID=66713 RepID=A0AA88Y8L2_PINIB|nr:hypothetical protein FSP39_008319 [Pinctada imbricata]
MAASMTSSPHPDFQYLKQKFCQDLEQHLSKIKGKKDIFIDHELMKPLDRMAGAALLKNNGVDKIFKLVSNQMATDGLEQRVYLTRPRMDSVKVITEHVNADKGQNHKRKYHIIFVPRRLHLCEMMLEYEGIHGDVTISEIEMHLIPLDRDILSLELPFFFRTLFLDQDETWLHTVARSIIGVQSLANTIPNVYCIGRRARMTFDLVNMMLGDARPDPDYTKSEIGSLVIIDRDVDYVTPLCSQVTYEGLLDDSFGIKCGFIEFGPEVTGKDQTAKLLLTSDDQIFEEVRNRHFSNVLGYLSEKAKSLQQDFDKRHTLQSVGDMKNFVSKELRGLKQQKTNLAYHIGACEQILMKKNKDDFEEYLQTEHSFLEGSSLRENITFVEELVQKQHSMIPTLKLFSLLSLTQDGVSSRDYKSLKTQFLHSHGFEQMLTFNNLNKLGMLTEQDQSGQISTPIGKMPSGVNLRRSSYRNLCKKLNLVPKTEDIDLKRPTNMAYVFSGAYSPLSCKLIEQVLNKEGFSGLEDITKYLTGDVYSRVEVRDHSRPKSAAAGPKLSKTVMVYFLGGCTYSEITALRFLGRIKGYRFIISTTSIINGSTLLNSVVEKSR